MVVLLVSRLVQRHQIVLVVCMAAVIVILLLAIHDMLPCVLLVMFPQQLNSRLLLRQARLQMRLLARRGRLRRRRRRRLRLRRLLRR